MRIFPLSHQPLSYNFWDYIQTYQHQQLLLIERGMVRINVNCLVLNMISFYREILILASVSTFLQLFVALKIHKATFLCSLQHHVLKFSTVLEFQEIQ